VEVTEPTHVTDEGRRSVLTIRRVVAVVALAFVVRAVWRRLRFMRDVLRYRRRLQLAFSVLLLVRRLRKG
jgi:hypothetical protein